MAHSYSYTTWTPDLATGNAHIDEQHRQWIDALNALFDAYRSGRCRKEVEETMDFLISYTDMHFGEEEAMLEGCGYPDLLRHQALHGNFKETAKEMRRELIKEGQTDEFITNLYVTMGRWVVGHIKGEDFIWARFTKSKAPEA
jgi:hemerythrin